MKIHTLITSCLLLNCAIANTQQTIPITISGKIEGEVNSVYSVKVYYYYKYISLGNIENRFDTTVFVDRKGNFKFCLPPKLIGKIGQLVIYYDSTNKDDNDVLDNYVIENGDNINMAIKVKNHRVAEIKADGNGAAKYQCRSNLILKGLMLEYERWDRADSLRKSPKRIANTTQSSSKEDVENIWRATIVDKSELIKTATCILESYKKEINLNVYEIMKADLIGQFCWPVEKMQQALYSFILSINDTLREINTRNYLLTRRLSQEKFPDKVIALSPSYVDYVYENEVTSLSLEKRADYKEIILSFTDLYFRFKVSYKGELRERLLTEILVNPNQNAGLIAMGKKRMAFIRDVLDLIKAKEFREKIESAAISKVMEGETAYNFNLPDTTLKLVSLANLRGNVILMDMWYTGCGGCLQFADKIRTQIKPFIDSHYFKIVSINTDPSINMWMKSLYSGRYTEPENINLQAQTSSQNSLSFQKLPIVKFYGLNYLPFVLLIDQKGKIISQFSNNDNVEDIIRKIKIPLSEELH